MTSISKKQPALNSPPKKAKGRPTKWEPRFVAIVAGMTEVGATDREIAEQLKVTVRTLNFWKKDYPDLVDAMRVGKNSADNRVEMTLYHRAVGYTYESEKIFNHQGKIIRAKTIEHVPPDTTAAIFWLKNRRPAEWREKQDVRVDLHVSLADLVNQSYAPILPALPASTEETE